MARNRKLRLALIGSREAPRKYLDLMSLMGLAFSEAGHFSYSGGAPGSDEAWLSRYDRHLSLRIIPYDGFNHCHTGIGVVCWSDLSNESRIKSYVKAKQAYPGLDSERDIIKTLFCRNAMQVLGEDCMSPVDHVYYWCPVRNGEEQGGTRIATRIARQHGIPCTNLNDKKVFEELQEQYAPKFDIFSL
ncbi:hypothetical protein SEA1_gp0172 [Salmonella phage SEA1]|nr:hypothetical protein SEA1_gp0172 [Salmonella phage SEA1]